MRLLQLQDLQHSQSEASRCTAQVIRSQEPPRVFHPNFSSSVSFQTRLWHSALGGVRHCIGNFWLVLVDNTVWKRQP
eukprot:3231948-Amphidinium_carterae.2